MHGKSIERDCKRPTELRDMMTPEEKEQEAAKTAENQRRMSEYFHQKYGWAKAAKKK